MGGRSSSGGGGSTDQKTDSTMSSLSKKAGSLGEAAQGYGNLQTAILGSIFPAFGEVVKGGMESFNSHPMGTVMGAALGMPIQVKTPEFAQNFIDKYSPQEPAQAPAQQAPQPYNVNEDMRARMGMGSPYGQYGQYGQYGPQRNSMFGGVGK